jgi:hypothetical protein
LDATPAGQLTDALVGVAVVVLVVGAPMVGGCVVGGRIVGAPVAVGVAVSVQMLDASENESTKVLTLARRYSHCAEVEAASEP